MKDLITLFKVRSSISVFTDYLLFSIGFGPKRYSVGSRQHFRQILHLTPLHMPIPTRRLSPSCLYRHGTNNRLYRLRYYQFFHYLSSLLILLEQDAKRSLWRSGSSLFDWRYLQPSTRHDSHCVTDAYVMGSSDAEREKSGSDGGFWAWRWVRSAPSMLALKPQPILTFPLPRRNRICIVSILRIKYLNELNPHDITYSIAPLGLFTLLEPTLGIISACLPVIRPVINNLLKKPTLPTSSEYLTSKASRSAPARHSSHGPNGGFAPKRFQRLDDHAYPLTNRYSNFNEVGGSANDACSRDQDVEEQAYVSDPGDRKNAVVVNTKSGWDIDNDVV